MDLCPHIATPSQGFETQPHVPHGPTELDPSLFSLVSGGGSPRTGWAALVDTEAVSSPRTGWQ